MLSRPIWVLLLALEVASSSAASMPYASASILSDKAQKSSNDNHSVRGKQPLARRRHLQQDLDNLNASITQTDGVALLENNNNSHSGEVCPPCPTECAENSYLDQRLEEPPPTSSSSEPPLTLQILVVDSPGIITMVQWNAEDYYQYTNGRVRVEIKLAPTMPALFEEIENDARSGGGLFDAYYTNPVILGTAAMLNGFLDLTEFVKESPHADWTDVLLALRTYVTSFEDKIYIILLDGDTHTMFYRKDVLEYYGLQVPRTWNEYNEVAKAIHGKVFNGIELSGSCVSRIQGDHAMYWYHLVLSTITQTQGTSEGSLFDTKDMTPLTGAAAAEMLRIHEEQAKYGTYDEFTDIINHVQNGHMNDGSCAMTFMWGDMFRRSKAEGSILHDKLGIAPTPGSEVVLDRKTGKLERCTLERCPYAKYYEDIGFVNSAPYAANGGWGAAISANTTPEKQKALAEFFLWASSRDQSQQYVIPNATLPWFLINGQDPWRKSQLDVDKWVERGFDRELSKQYVESILTNLVSKNVVVEARFPKAGEIMSVLDKEVNEYLVGARGGRIPEERKHQERLKTAQAITNQWNQIIRAYNSRGDTVAPILEIYQRLRGVYVPNERKNYLTSIRPVGLTLMAIIAASSLCAAIWVYWKRETSVVRASQPPFLALICLGTLVMGSSIYSMGIDDGVASQDSCSRACMATPWLVAVGFSITFAALSSKIFRLKVLLRNAAQFRRIQVKVQDVLLPFCVILLVNMVLLVTWTAMDPLYWERVYTGRTESGELSSYGRCTSDGTLSSVLLGLIAATNMLALLSANVLAYQTRELSVAFNESKFVGIAMASILQAMLIGLPLLFLADTNTTAKYVVRSVLVFVICMSVLVFIFLPKFLCSEDSMDVTTFSEEQRRRSKGFSSHLSDRRSWDMRTSQSRNSPSSPKGILKRVSFQEAQQVSETRYGSDSQFTKNGSEMGEDSSSDLKGPFGSSTTFEPPSITAPVAAENGNSAADLQESAQTSQSVSGEAELQLLDIKSLSNGQGVNSTRVAMTNLDGSIRSLDGASGELSRISEE